MYANYTEESCTGTGVTLELAGVTTGSIPFSASFADGDPVAYVVEDSGGVIIVAGIGTYVAATDDITRADTWNWNGTVIDDAPVSDIPLSGGTHKIHCGPIADDMDNLVHKTGIESIGGVKTFTDNIEINASGKKIKLTTDLSDSDDCVIALHPVAVDDKPWITWYDAAGLAIAGVVAHEESISQTIHKHFSIETSDLAGALQTRLQVDYGLDQSLVSITDADFKIGAGNHMDIGTSAGADCNINIYGGQFYRHNAGPFGIGDKADWVATGVLSGTKWEFYRATSSARMSLVNDDGTSNAELHLKSGTRDWFLSNDQVDFVVYRETVPKFRVSNNTSNFETALMSERTLINTDVTATISGTQLRGGLITSTPTGPITLTTQTASGSIIPAMDASVDDSSYEFTIINLAAFDLTLAGGTGVSLVGNMVINNESGTFLLRRLTSTTVAIYRK